jgi:hypothetical protein
MTCDKCNGGIGFFSIGGLCADCWADKEYQRLIDIDSMKLLKFVDAMSAVTEPKVKTSEAIHYLDRATDHIKQAVEILSAFTEKYANK